MPRPKYQIKTPQTGSHRDQREDGQRDLHLRGYLLHALPDDWHSCQKHKLSGQIDNKEIAMAEVLNNAPSEITNQAVRDNTRKLIP